MNSVLDSETLREREGRERETQNEPLRSGSGLNLALRDGAGISELNPCLAWDSVRKSMRSPTISRLPIPSTFVRTVTGKMSDHFCYLRWKGAYTRGYSGAAAWAASATPLPMWDVEGSSTVP